MNLKFEREFIKLASIVLACRLRAMGGIANRGLPPAGDLAFALLGIVDYSNEMRLLVNESLLKARTLSKNKSNS